MADRLERAALLWLGFGILGPTLPVAAALPLVVLGMGVPDGPDSQSALHVVPVMLGLLRGAYTQGGALAGGVVGLGAGLSVLVWGTVSGRAISLMGVLVGLSVGLAPFWPMVAGTLPLSKRQLLLGFVFAGCVVVTAKVLELLARRLDLLPPAQ